MNSSVSVQIWSAVPTPLESNLCVDVISVEKMVEDAARNNIDGLFLAGTCGEGPWLQDTERSRLISAAVKAAAGRMKIAAQASDNSVPRILDNIKRVGDAGADYAILAAPTFFMNATSDRIAAVFERAIMASPLPIGIYDLGQHRPVHIPEDRLQQLYLLPNVHLVKDSSGSPARRDIALSARRINPTLKLLNGDEFKCVDYLQAGYDGCMFGGAAAVAPYIVQIIALIKLGKLDEARRVDAEMKSTLYGIYGGESIACWLSGLKHYMVCRGLFASRASYLEYPLTEECRAFVERYSAKQQLDRAVVAAP